MYVQYLYTVLFVNEICPNIAVVQAIFLLIDGSLLSTLDLDWISSFSLLAASSCVAALCSLHWKVTKQCLTSFTGNLFSPCVTWVLFPLVLLQRSCLRAVKCSRYVERGTNTSSLWWLCMAGMGDNSCSVLISSHNNIRH